MKTYFSESELRAVKHMIKDLAKRCREGIPETIHYTGASAFLKAEEGESVMRLARKLSGKKPEVIR